MQKKNCNTEYYYYLHTMVWLSILQVRCLKTVKFLRRF